MPLREKKKKAIWIPTMSQALTYPQQKQKQNKDQWNQTENPTTLIRYD